MEPPHGQVSTPLVERRCGFPRHWFHCWTPPCGCSLSSGGAWCLGCRSTAPCLQPCQGAPTNLDLFSGAAKTFWQLCPGVICSALQHDELVVGLSRRTSMPQQLAPHISRVPNPLEHVACSRATQSRRVVVCLKALVLTGGCFVVLDSRHQPAQLIATGVPWNKAEP